MVEWEAKIRVARKDELWHRVAVAATEAKDAEEVEEIKELEDSDVAARVGRSGQR